MLQRPDTTALCSSVFSAVPKPGLFSRLHVKDIRCLLKRVLMEEFGVKLYMKVFFFFF